MLIVDIRRSLTEFDQMLLEWSNNRNLATLILLTKSDKLNFGPGKQVCLDVKRVLKDHSNLVDVIPFSSLKKTGIKESRRALSKMINDRFQENLETPPSIPEE